ncbi:transporter substrate-binding domain-containing protein [Clostridium sp. B9]|uniref:transporter substrate-binding domain-containing protein n=1 Tax=Clostridium sp. B9 TaxID=3423224 RepID=UPI003D2F26BF
MSLKKKYIIKITIVLVLLLSLNFAVLGKKFSTKVFDNKGVLTVGMELKFPPFETVDKDGNPTGVSVDMANAIGEKLGMKVKIKNIDYSGLIPALQSNNIDLIISSMGITEDREKTIDFSKEYARSDLGLAVNKNYDIKTYKDLNNPKYTIAAKQGTIGAMWAKENLPKAHLKEFTEVSAAMLDVNNGGSTAFIYDPLSLIESSQNLSNINLVLEPLPGVKGWGIGMRKGNEELKDKVNKALDELREEGFFENTREKYLKDQVEKYKSYGLEYFF